jgi:hypothetical protein
MLINEVRKRGAGAGTSTSILTWVAVGAALVMSSHLLALRSTPSGIGD